MNGTRVARAVGALATVAGVFLVAPGAMAAGPYALDAHIDSVPNGGNYTPSSFNWTDPFEITFTHTTDATTVALIGFAQSHQDVGTAVVHETLNGTAVVTLQMSHVQIQVVHEEGNVNNPNGPQETVVLHYRQVVYTYQPVTPTGQKAGPPVSITYSR